MSKLILNYNDPIKIMDISVWQILLHKICGLPVRFKKMDRFTGSTPVSLDIIKIFELCKDLDNNTRLLPFKQYDTSPLYSSDAIVNVSFENINSIDVKNISRIFPVDCKPKGKNTATIWKNLSVLYYLNRINLGMKKEDLKVEKSIKTAIEKKLKNGNNSETDKEYLNKTLHDYREAFTDVIRTYLDNDPSLESETLGSGSIVSKARYLLYRDGFDVETEYGIRHYRMYKRSASKSKKGNCVFIVDSLYDKMMDYSWMGLHFTEGEWYDLTSIRAYESLVMSSITGTVNIPRNSILMLDSVESPQIHGNCQIFTKVKNKAELLTDDQYKDIFGKPFTHKNILWDGQALLDKSIFEKAGYTGDNKHGMMLLRNSFFKACAFNTNIQKYYKDNHVKEVTDMFGNKLKAKDIRMIVTIDSFKMDKFAPVFYHQIKKINDEKPSDNANDLEKRKTIYKYWLEHIDEKFGIVKEEKPSHLGHGKYHEISYQILNTLPLSKDDIIKITKDDREYIERLRSDTDFSVFLYHIRTNDQSLRKKFFIYNMLRHCPDFENTTYFKKFRLDEINQYKENMRKGRLKLRGDFYVLCSMPMEMLEYSVHRDVGQIHPYLSKNTAYIHGIKAEEDIPLFRYPHMNSGSVCVLKTQDCTEYDRYFNLDHNTGSNIIVLSPWESNVMAKLGGADFDSDTALYIKDPIILSAAKKLAEFEWMNSNDEGPSIALTDKILKGDPKTYSYDPIGFASLDTSLAKSAIEIGSLSNDAQLFNSYLWEGYKSGKDTKYLHLIYNCILKLAALNELEIDRAKHSIGIPISAIHDEIKKVKFNGNPVIEKTNSDNESKDKTYIPFFMYDTKNPQKNRYKALREGKLKLWNCPVDYISMVLKEEPGLSRTKKQSINDLSLLFELKGDKPNEGQLKVFRDEISELLEEIDSIDRDRNLDDSERAEKKKQRYDEYLNSICKKKITLATMRRLFQYAFDKYKCDAKDGSYKKNDYKYPKLANNKNKFRYLGLLFDIGEIYFEKKKTCTNLAIECIKNNTQKDIKVIKYAPFCDHPDVILWGDPYSVKVE